MNDEKKYPGEKLEGDETAYLKLSNGRFLRFAWGIEQPEDPSALGVINFDMFTPDGEKKLVENTVDAYDNEDVFHITQLIMTYLGYREEQDEPILYLPMAEDRFFESVAAA